MNNKLNLVARFAKGAITIESDWWQVRHERRQGGCVSDIWIRYGSNANLLAQTSAATVDAWSEANEPKPNIRVRTKPGEIQVRVSGRLFDGRGRPGPVRYTHVYRYTPWSIKHTLRLTTTSALSVRRFCPTTLSFASPATHYVWGTSDFAKAKPRYLHIIGPHYDDMMGEVSNRQGVLQEDSSRPWNVAFIRRGQEGLQWCGDSRVSAWDGVSQQRAFRLTRTSSGLDFEPLLVVPGSPVPLRRESTLGWYWFLPNIERLGRPRFNEIVVQTNPFPGEEMLDAWSRRGVDLLRIHNDSDSIHGSDEYWHDGRHPPFGPVKMRQMQQFLRAAHRRGMKVVPYYSGWELSPDTKLFARHAEEWFAPAQPGGKKRYTPNAGAGVYGGLMCPDSGWSRALERNIRAAIDELGFDGFYLDWSSPLPCFNERHAPGQHNGIDGLHDMLVRLRRRYPNKVIVIHSGGQLMWLFHHNLADQYVTLEEGKKEGGFTPETPEEYPVTADFMGVGPASAVPDIYLGRDRTKLYRGLIHAVLLGVPPYSYYFRFREFGYEDWREEARDPRGILAMMAKYSRIDWSKYHFYSASTGVAKSARESVATAVYLGDRDGILVAGNLRHRPATATSATVRLEQTFKGGAPVRVAIPALKGWEWRFIRFHLVSRQRAC